MSKEKKINLINPQAYINNQPHEQFDWLKQHAPYFKHTLFDDKSFWAVTRYDDVYQINRNHQDFSSTSSVMFENHGCPHDPSEQDSSTEQTTSSKEKKKMMINMDPPEHTKYRRLISKDFTPSGVRGWDKKISQISTDVVDSVIHKGRCEFVSEVSGELAGRVTAALLGLPQDQGNLLYEYTELFHSMPGTISAEKKKIKAKELSAYLKEVIRIKLKNDDGDISCRFLFGKVDDEFLNKKDFFQQFMLMVNGGTDTARNVISVGLYELLRNPEQLAWLMEDLDARMPSAREELLRFISPVIYQCRTATRDMELDGNSIKKDDILALFYGAANYDTSKFDEPHKLNLARENNKHIAFGGGHHICVGQWLARIEIDEMFKEVLSRFKNIQVVGEPQWLESNFLFGLKNMEITFET